MNHSDVVLQTQSVHSIIYIFIYLFFEPQFPAQQLGTSLWEPNSLRINEGEAVSRENIFN